MARPGAACTSAILAASGFRAQSKRQNGDQPEPTMLQPFAKRPEHVAALERVRAWTRERFELAADAAVLVSEVSCALPGCPPRETVVAFWTENEQRHQFKLFKPVAEVAADDLPPAWLKGALVAVEGLGCECC
jgi:hypothetical protein